MGERFEKLKGNLGRIQDDELVPIILMQILAALDDILDELRAQSAVDDEEQGHMSLSDQ